MISKLLTRIDDGETRGRKAVSVRPLQRAPFLVRGYVWLYVTAWGTERARSQYCLLFGNLSSVLMTVTHRMARPNSALLAVLLCVFHFKSERRQTTHSRLKLNFRRWLSFS